MSKVKFIHIRNEDDNEMGTVKSKGGATIAFTNTEDGKVMFAVAHCNPKDVYHKARGRQIAEGRLLCGRKDNVHFVDHKDGENVYELILGAM